MSSYRALYRKWRPMRFSDVVGQKQVSDTLKTAVATNRIAHAYLFCGTEERERPQRQRFFRVRSIAKIRLTESRATNAPPVGES